MGGILFHADRFKDINGILLLETGLGLKDTAQHRELATCMVHVQQADIQSAKLMNDCVHIKFVQCHPLFYMRWSSGRLGTSYFVYRLICNNLPEAVKVKGQSIWPPQELNKTSSYSHKFIIKVQFVCVHCLLMYWACAFRHNSYRSSAWLWRNRCGFVCTCTSHTQLLWFTVTTYTAQFTDETISRKLIQWTQYVL